jgi:tRNA nucleotidyltransferase (CCA-adding enzyme)
MLLPVDMTCQTNTDGGMVNRPTTPMDPKTSMTDHKRQKTAVQSTAGTGVTVITTHINADFDAMASMLAAQKLYPEALVVFPGSREKNLRNFFIQSMVYLFNLTQIKDIKMEDVKHLVLVDTRRIDRIGKLRMILQNPDITVDIYDHHSRKKDDIKGDIDVYRQTGATATLIIDLIRQKELPVSPEEATIMCLGIYEDTGSFTFSSTTPEDLEAAAYLISLGANVDVISNLIIREISPEQVGYLNDLIQAAMRYTINGVEIMITTICFDHYLPDFAFLVHKMVKMEEVNAIFALAMMESKVYIVARSRSSEVDVGTILNGLGGGGHPSAAAASIKGQTLTQVQHALLRELAKGIKSQRQSQHLMSCPPICIGSELTCAEANAKLTRYNINALLVTTQEGNTQKLLGYITRQVIEKAIHHDLGRAAVKDYMTTEIVVTAPDADLDEIQEKIIGNKQRILPVVSDNVIHGVITRTDLLNVLVQKSRLTHKGYPDPDKNHITARMRNITHLLQERLSTQILNTLKRVGQIADQLGYQAYVVGGFVRDLFLYRRNEDIDIVIEGDGIAFARAYAKAYDARIHSHKAFGTAVIIFKDGYKIDVATARLEYYRSPAALPDVEMSSIKQDLFRRDFTINTLSLHLNPNHFGYLIDFFQAQKDIKDKAIRVLHNLSFVEDPTRVFRALRFEQRFGFSIGKLTCNLIDNAVKMEFFKRLSGRRTFTEIKLLLEEENPTPAIIRMQDFDLLKVIHPSIILDRKLIYLLNAVKSAIAWHDLQFTEDPFMQWAVYLMALIRNCDLTTSKRICETLELAPRYRRLLCEDRLKAEKRLQHMEYRPPADNSALYRQLYEFRTEHILYMMAVTRKRMIKKYISKYYNRLKDIQPSIGGQELLDAGLTPGPIFRHVLDALLDAKLNGDIKTKQDEMEFLKHWIDGHPTHNLLDSGATSQ